jgi:hypothetical protein
MSLVLKVGITPIEVHDLMQDHMYPGIYAASFGHALLILLFDPTQILKVT